MKRIIEIDEKDLERIREIVERENKTALSVTTRGTAYITIADSKPYEERPQGDLISREALKEAFKIEELYWGKRIIGIIDNAPTVKFSLLPADESKDEAFMRGYEKGKIEGILKAHTRPKGEWIKVKEEVMSVDIVTLYKCSECERVIATLPSKLAKYYPFCHCGADMQKGGDDQ